MPIVLLIVIFCFAPVFAEELAIELHDDFENSKPASFWLPGDYGSGLYVPGAAAVSTNYARSGKQSLRVTVHEGDVASPGGDGKMTERADLDSGHFPLLGKQAVYSFSVYSRKISQSLITASSLERANNRMSRGPF